MALILYLCAMNEMNQLVDKCLKSMGVDALNDMQNAAIEACSEHRDLILLSPTGSGKTLAYLLPILMNLKADCTGVQALIIAPSRELVQQIEQVWRSMSTGYKVNSCYGGRPSNSEKRELTTPPALLIGTPGRLQDHIQRGNFDPHTIKLLVLDEFDKSLEMGFTEQMEIIIGMLPSLSQRILTSATDAVKIPAFTGISNPIKLNYIDSDSTAIQLNIHTVKGTNNDKMDLLYQLLCYLGNDSSLIFCNQRDTVEKVNAYLTTRKVPNEFFHGKLEQTERERALSKFRNGSCTAFISTDLAARGLDIPEIRHVIHFDPPVREEEFVHRNGRTARMQADGNAYLLLGQTENLPEFIRPVPKALSLPVLASMPPKPDWATIYIGKGKKDKISKMDIVGFMFKKGNLAKDELGMVEVKEYYSYVAVKASKVKTLLSLIQNEKVKNMKCKIELSE